MSNPVVNIEQGKIKGLESKNQNNVQYYSFKSIPFARPPVGELRFSVPQPPEPWEGVRDGTMECNICAQFDKVTNTVAGDEDCLYLNVFTPKLPVSNSPLLPVMVYLHGGGFVFGNATDTATNGPDYLMEKDVVLVTPNYRVGILGFLSLDCKEAPGNMGLRDQVQALKWIQSNIANFGGDPNNVTIFGVSAGGASVEYLMLSPLAKGLFHKAIAQSGSSLLHWAQNTSAKFKKLAHSIPAMKSKTITENNELLKYLKELSVTELVASSMAAIQADTFKGGIHFGFVPIIENPTDWEPFLCKSSYQLLTNGEFSKVPFMTGICSREGLLMVSHGAPILEKLVKEKVFINFFPFELDEAEKHDVEARLKKVYLEGEHLPIDENAFAIDFFSDVDFLGGVYTAAMLVAKHNSSVYFYEFAYDGALNYLKKKYNIPQKGACHGDDGGYLLKCDILPNSISATDKYVQDMMLDLWTNFAKNGDPNQKFHSDIPIKWVPISKTSNACFVIDKEPVMKYEVYPSRSAIYQELYKKKHCL